MLHRLAQSTVKSHPVVHRPFLFHMSKLRADSDPTQGDPAGPGWETAQLEVTKP